MINVMKIKRGSNRESNINSNFNNNNGKCDCCDNNKYIKKNYSKKDLIYHNYDKLEYLKPIYKSKPLKESTTPTTPVTSVVPKKRNITYRAIILSIENNDSREIYETFQTLIDQNKSNK